MFFRDRAGRGSVQFGVCVRGTYVYSGEGGDELSEISPSFAPRTLGGILHWGSVIWVERIYLLFYVELLITSPLYSMVCIRYLSVDFF